MHQNNLEKENKIEQLTNEKIELYKINDEKDIQISELAKQNKKLLNRAVNLTKSKQDLYNKYDEQKNEYNKIIKKNEELSKNIEKNNKKISDLITIKNQQEAKISSMQDDIKIQIELHEINKAKLNEIESSNSWKLTEPMRKLRFKFKSIKNKFSKDTKNT